MRTFSKSFVLITAITAMLVGTTLGGLGILEAQKAKQEAAYFLDKNGKEVHIGDVIKIDHIAFPIKAHGWYYSPKAGTAAGYEYQTELCPKCDWKETYPPVRKAALNGPLSKEQSDRSILARFLELFAPNQVFAADGDSIIWGS